MNYTAKPVDKPLIIRKLKEENEWLKKSIKRQQLSNEECSKYIEELVKENKQLRHDLNVLKRIVFGGFYE